MPRILLPARLENCAVAMAFLRENLAEGHEDMLGFVELAVEELLVNVVNYAYAGLRQASMDDQPFLCVWIRDWGAPFDPFLNAPKPDTSLDAEDRPLGGLGVHLVRNVSAHHCYSGEDGENTIELYFKMPSGQG